MDAKRSGSMEDLDTSMYDNSYSAISHGRGDGSILIYNTLVLGPFILHTNDHLPNIG